jgi:hypothetical protein
MTNDLTPKRLEEIRTAWHLYLHGDKRVQLIETAIPFLLALVESQQKEIERKDEALRMIEQISDRASVKRWARHALSPQP